MKKSNKHNERLGEERLNNQGCLMKIVEYIDNKNIVVEFQDKYKAKVHTEYDNFKKGVAKNPYHPTVCGVGMLGVKYPSKVNGKNTKEYIAWLNMLRRCYEEAVKNRNKTYKNATCCKEWLLFENFYEWLHNQENFNKWLNGCRWSLDKDILIKGNKTYSPETCCLVPQNVNLLFVKRDNDRGDLPIGVQRNRRGFRAECKNQLKKETEISTTYQTPEQAFEAYKTYKEHLIKQVAQTEFLNGNITEKCYKAMMKYEVEITD